MIYYIIYVDAHETTVPSNSADPFKKKQPKTPPEFRYIAPNKQIK